MTSSFPASAADPRDDSGGSFGAYGLRLLGVAASHLLVPAPAEWPTFELVRRVRRRPARAPLISDDRAVVVLGANSDIVIDRKQERAVFTTARQLSDDELVHPYLASVPAVVSPWLGRESFHAGAFVHDGGVWGLIGKRQAGKSTMLAWLAVNGHDVFADDVLVLAGATAFAGPRSVDLRTESAQRLGAGEPLGVIGSRERWRLTLGPVEPELPLRGWICLDWGESVEAVRMSGAQRLQRLASERALLVAPADPAVLVGLAALPCWELGRPRGWSSVSETGTRLLELVAG